MNRESFSQNEVANVINANFIAIKIDREERPNLDAFYVDLLESYGISSGWPMNLWLSPRGEFLYATSYLNKPDLIATMSRIDQVWRHDPERIKSLLANFGSVVDSRASQKNSTELRHKLFDSFVAEYLDRERSASRIGSVSPRFLQSLELAALFSSKSLPKEVESVVEQTLVSMSTKGLYDPVDGGFFRYAVDSDWNIPHFEKTLYDNAQIMAIYAEADNRSHSAEFENLARDTLNFVNRLMRSPYGGYYAALGAESFDKANSVSVAGFYYGFNKRQLDQVNLDSQILQRKAEDGDLIFLQRKRGALLDAVKRSSLQKMRAEKKFPDVDHKIITSWNALMISSLARLHQIYGDEGFLAEAKRTVRYLKSYNYKEKKLFRYSIDSQTSIPALVEDYSFLIRSLIDLYQSNFEKEWLDWALELQNKLDQEFWYENRGLYVDTDLFASGGYVMDQGRDLYIPAPNVVAAENLLKLSVITGRIEFKQRVHKMLQALSGFKNHAIFYPSLARLVNLVSKPTLELAIVGPLDDPRTVQVLHYAHHSIAKTIVMTHQPKSDQRETPNPSKKTMLHGELTFYLCLEDRCLMPTHSPKEVIKQIESEN